MFASKTPRDDRVQHNPVNPILTVARRAHEDGQLAAFIEGFMRGARERANEHPLTTHARKVLSRLARLQEGSHA